MISYVKNKGVHEDEGERGCGKGDSHIYWFWAGVTVIGGIIRCVIVIRVRWLFRSEVEVDGRQYRSRF